MRCMGGLAAVAACGLMSSAASAEVTSVNIGETYGLTHLPSYVMVDEHFIEQEAQRRGLPPIKVGFQQAGNGNVVADLLLSGHVNVAMSGLTPFITLWDKLRSKMPIKGIGALAAANILLMTTDPRIKSIKDYKDADRIAMTDVKTTTFAILLQMEAAKLYGWNNRNHFTSLAVPMSQSDGMNAMLSGKTVIKSQMTNLPYSTIERESGRVRTIFSSKDLFGTPITATMAFTTVKFHDENPKVYASIAAAYQDAVQFINQHPRDAAAIYLRHEPQHKLNLEKVVKLMDPNGPDQLTYGLTPHAVKGFADFMAKAGDIKQSAPSWRDFFFENVRDKQGS